MLLRMYLRVLSSCTCQVHLFKSGPTRATPMLHKSHERLTLSANCSLKGNFDVWKWRWVSFKERPTGVLVPGEGRNSGMCDTGCFPDY